MSWDLLREHEVDLILEGAHPRASRLLPAAGREISSRRSSSPRGHRWGRARLCKVPPPGNGGIPPLHWAGSGSSTVRISLQRTSHNINH